MARDSWSVLPTDLLSKVFNLVSFYDLVRLTALCKSWRQPVLDDLRRRHRNPPWIISLDNGQLRKLDLIDPWRNTSYSLLKTITQDGVKELLLGSRVLACKYGWLFMSKQEVIKSQGSNKLVSFLFYNPFRNEIIEVPPLDLNSKNIHESRAMFSTTPTSPDCVIFVVSRVTREGSSWGISMLSTYKEKNWTSVTDGCHDWDVQDVVHMDGKFYCNFNGRNCRTSFRLGIYNVAFQQWSTELYFLEEVYRYMFELDGELFLVTNVWNTSWKVRQLDRSEKNWRRRTKSLGDGVFLLFVNQMSIYSSSIAGLAAVGEAKELANMIVHLGPFGYKTYACKDHQGEWTHHQTRDGYRFNPYTFWIDSPNF